MEVISLIEPREQTWEFLSIVKWQEREFAVPLAQLIPIRAGKRIESAFSQWHQQLRLEARSGGQAAVETGGS